MEARFDIAVDAAHNLLRVRVEGFLDAAAFAAMMAARDRALVSLRCAPHEHLLLADVRTLSIQGQDMFARFQRSFAQPTVRSRRAACVVASTLSRMQFRRAVGERYGHDVLFFHDIAAAERWLLNPEADAIDAG